MISLATDCAIRQNDPMPSSWDDAAGWYSGCVGEKGHTYHQSLILPNALRLLNLQPGESLLDLGCGQGVLSRHLPPGVTYVGVDSSSALILTAKRLSKNGAAFYTADVSSPLPIAKKDFDALCFILSLQNMEHPGEAIAQATKHLKPGGKCLLILNHPCFRIPRQSHWGIDAKEHLQYRRLNLYMSSLKIPIQVRPSQGQKSETVDSFHAPLSAFVQWLMRANIAIATMEEWCSDKKSHGARAKMENRARQEFPLFLAIFGIFRYI